MYIKTYHILFYTLRLHVIHNIVLLFYYNRAVLLSLYCIIYTELYQYTVYNIIYIYINYIHGTGISINTVPASVLYYDKYNILAYAPLHALSFIHHTRPYHTS